ncbi:ribbon-helix-helix protein, CopG family [Sinomonas sp. ASV486]|uniref:ribbon-helix-helix protein, CopG family n=1 Tax=Sinomonas sp. ASV486 TaxID=3051170 RepID=UPI0027DDA0D1|nr:ribbon-helix-helix protein, CopG family [Sinomonas sp. ASV486]MDQ4490178.1 ribbon-helix-helix protein, CopG family [Sinomonas sp. ASV486]
MPTTQAPAAEQQLVRLNVNMNEKTARELREVAERGGYSITEVVRRAIALYRFVWGETKNDRILVITDRDGKNRSEIVLM